MINESFIINKVTNLYFYITDLVKKSYVYYLFIFLGKYFDKISRNSLILNFFSENWDIHLKSKDSLLMNAGKQLVSNISTGIEHTNSKIILTIKDSFIVNIANENMLLVFVYFLLFLIPIAPTMILACISMMCIAIYVLNIVIGKIEFQKPSVLGCFIGIFLCCYVASTLTSYSRMKAIKIMIIFMSFALMTFIIVRSINNKKRLNVAINAVLLSGVLVSLYGIFQYFTGAEMDAAWLDTEAFAGISVRVYATFSNPNVLGEYLIIITSLAIGMLWMSKDYRFKCAYFAVALITGICLFMTSSRGSMLGLFIALAIFILVAEKRFIILGIFCAMLMPFILPQSIWGRLLSVVNMSDSSSLYRISIYKASIDMIEDFWTTGIGVGAFNLVYPIYAFNASYAYHSHNIFLQIFIELGIVGFVSFIGTIFLYMQKMYYGVRNSLNEYKYIMAVILGGFIGLLFQGLADYLWFDYSIVLLFWAVMGLGIAAVNVGANKKDE